MNITVLWPRGFFP